MVPSFDPTFISTTLIGIAAHMRGVFGRCHTGVIRSVSVHPSLGLPTRLRILVYLVIYESGKVSLQHLLLSWYPSQTPPINYAPPRVAVSSRVQNHTIRAAYTTASGRDCVKSHRLCLHGTCPQTASWRVRCAVSTINHPPHLCRSRTKKNQLKKGLNTLT